MTAEHTASDRPDDVKFVVPLESHPVVEAKPAHHELLPLALVGLRIVRESMGHRNRQRQMLASRH
jgi:hypothetical protein